MLFSVVNLARFRKDKSSEFLLQETIRKFQKRFMYMERRLAESEIPLQQASIEEMEACWSEAKEAEV